MKRNPLIATLCIWTIALPCVADTFTLKDGTVLEGTITKVEWMNPHVFFYMDVSEAGGKGVNWACEMGSPNSLQRQGWTRNTLQLGMKGAFEGTLAKDGTPKTNARNVTVGGKKLGAASSEGVTP